MGKRRLQVQVLQVQLSPGTRISSSQRLVGRRGWRPAWLEMNKWDKWEKGSGNSDDYVNVSVTFEQGSVTVLLKGPCESGSHGLHTPAVQCYRSMMMLWTSVLI